MKSTKTDPSILAYFADLTHTAQGMNAKTFPLGIGCVVAYAQKEIGDFLATELFKLPKDLDEALSTKIPDLLCLSNYSWNFRLAYRFAQLAKKKKPDLIIVMGGPNYPLDEEKKVDFLKKNHLIDFYIANEGEEGFVDLLRKLKSNNLDAEIIKSKEEPIINCEYLHNDRLIQGTNRRIEDLDLIPSPYTSGVLDDFFNLSLIPLFETNRGCPFACTFCSDGIDFKSRVFRYSEARTAQTLEYISKKITNCNELITADLNFGMYETDIITAKKIAQIKSETGYPISFYGTAGKNKPDRTIQVTNIINAEGLEKGMIGAALQSTDPEVLDAIKRSNISIDKYLKVTSYGKEKGAETYSEIILGLPMDTLEKHFKSLQTAVDMGMSKVRMYQLILLNGSEMDTPETRQKYVMRTKWRVLPGCAGIYSILGEDHPVAEYEEIVIETNSLKYQEYLDCRMMNLIVEVFVNSAWFEEIGGLLNVLGFSKFEFLVYFKNHPEHYSEKIQSIFDSFLERTELALVETESELKTMIQKKGFVESYVKGERGGNELLNHKALCYFNLKETHQAFFKAFEGFLKEKSAYTENIADYINEIERFSLMRKTNLEKSDLVHYDYFKYDFKTIADKNFEINPDELRPNKKYRTKFWHEPHQVTVINNALNIYGSSLAGMGKLIQRNDLRLMYRKFSFEQEVESPVVS